MGRKGLKRGLTTLNGKKSSPGRRQEPEQADFEGPGVIFKVKIA